MPNTFHFTEDSYEQSIISLFKEMGYEYHYGPELEAETGRELTDATIPGVLRKAMLVINGTDKAAKQIYPESVVFLTHNPETKFYKLAQHNTPCSLR